MNPAARDEPDATAVIPKVTDDTVILDVSTAETAVIDRHAVQAALNEPRPAAPGEPPVIRSHRRAGASPRRIIRVSGELMITFGLVLLLFAGYEIWGKAALVAGAQEQLNAQLEQEWSSNPVVAPSTPPPGESAGPVPPPAHGEAIARLYLPRLGKNWVVVEGVSPADIKYTPGHYPGTAMPGQLGNFSVAGHRIAAIFWDLDQLRPGDPVVVETRDAWYVYHVTEQVVVLPTAIEVVAPVPGQPGAAPTEALLTLTTCNPKFNNYQRLVVHARLDHTVAQGQGQPPELGG